jgi:3-hydroxyacyl-[acyl-carrier-protein] dehydratase
MRWFWIDRFEEFVSGQSAVAIKNFSLGEETFHGYFPGHPVMPGSLILEGIAQTGGMLVAELSEYRERLVLAKVSKFKYHFAPCPGDVLVYSVKLDVVRSGGALILGQCHVDDRLQAEAEFYLAVLPPRHEIEQLFEPVSFMRLLRLLRVYEVGTKPDGSPLRVPEHLLNAELAAGQL